MKCGRVTILHQELAATHNAAGRGISSRNLVCTEIDELVAGDGSYISPYGIGDDFFVTYHQSKVAATFETEGVLVLAVPKASGTLPEFCRNARRQCKFKCARF